MFQFGFWAVELVPTQKSMGRREDGKSLKLSHVLRRLLQVEILASPFGSLIERCVDWPLLANTFVSGDD
jgi:hypothetical protein